MTYKITRVIESDTLILEYNLTPVDVLNEEQILKLSFFTLGQKLTFESKNLKDFLTKLENIKDLSTVSVTLKDNLNSYIVDVKDLKIAQILNKVIFEIKYEREFKNVKVGGYASYDYVSYFMPQWSTAYKFEHSNHSKTAEPLFTDLKLNSLLVEKIIKGDKNLALISDKSEILINNFSLEKEKNLSEVLKEGLVDVIYSLNSDLKLDFKISNKIYIQRSFKSSVEIIVQGMYKNTFISETLILNDDGIKVLSLEYDFIYKIDILDIEDIEFATEDTFQVRIGNCLKLETNVLNYNSRKNKSNFKVEDSNLIYNLKNINTVFNLSSNSDSYNIYIDTLDNIFKIENKILYTGRVNAKLDLQIPRDMTYNNTKFIETTYLTSSEYLVEVLVLEYLKATNKSKISITLKNSLGSIYSLDENLNLKSSEEELFIDISNIKKDKITFEIFVNSDIEFIEISINDREGHHKKSNMIIHPRIDFKEVKSLDSLDEIVLIDDKISILNNYNLTLRESLHD